MSIRDEYMQHVPPALVQLIQGAVAMQGAFAQLEALDDGMRDPDINPEGPGFAPLGARELAAAVLRRVAATGVPAPDGSPLAILGAEGPEASGVQADAIRRALDTYGEEVARHLVKTVGRPSAHAGEA